jgi:hypothetical protein
VTAQSQFFPMAGGLDQETPALTMPPGRVIQCLNHEAVSRGYGRTEGCERFDGQPAPSEATFHTIDFEDGALAFTVGATLEGNNSGATARVLAAASVSSGSFAGGDAVGTVPVHYLSGEFEVGELLRIAAVTHARSTSVATIGDYLAGDDEEAWDIAAIEYARGLIQAVPGAGAVRGVLWYDGKLHAWRDNAAATAGVAHHSTATGWEETDLGRLLYFTAGGPYEIQSGDTITGVDSGATATVRTVATDADGDWADSDATGVLVIDPIAGIIDDEDISVGAHTAIAHVALPAQLASFPPGGRYDFEIFNFYGSTSFERAYGVNGVGPGFEFDGESIIPIATGMADDKPFLVTEHKYHLFFAFQQGSLQHSELGEPRSFNARLGAAELGMGHEITNIVGNSSSSLIVTTDTSTAVLTGNDSSDWVLEGLNKDAGAKARTAQQIGQVVYLDDVGLRSISASSAYGNFKIGTYTQLISTELEAKRRAGVFPVASCVVKSKDQYLLFFDDGTGISIYFGRKNPEAMTFEYPFTVSCLHIAAVDGRERVFVGATNGFVYELNKGVSFDGEDIEAFVALPFGHQGDPRSLKRYHKAAFELVGGPRSEIQFLAQFDYGNDYQPFTESREIESAGGGALWGLGTWGSFIWGAPAIARNEIFLQGVGANMGLIIRSVSSRMESYVLQGVTLMFSPRGRMR